MITHISQNGSRFLHPISKRALSEQVAAILKRLILVEDLQEGDKLPSERDLVSKLNVSHRVIREALDILSREKIIAKQHGKGAFIQKFKQERLRTGHIALSTHDNNTTDLHKIRCAIEVGALTLAVEHATEEDVAMLQETVEAAIRKREKGESQAEEEMRFHLGLLAATHNPVIQQLEALVIESLRMKMYDNPTLMYHSSMRVPTDEEHQQVVDALRARDAIKAMQTMYIHLKRSWDPAWIETQTHGTQQPPEADEKAGVKSPRKSQKTG